MIPTHLLARGIALVALLVSPGAHAARTLDLSNLGAPAFTTFSARDGVPEDVGSGIQVDRDGFVWLSTARGLARYDSHRWNGIDPPAINGVLGTFLLDHEGTLWVAFRDRGIARYDGRQWHSEGPDTGVPSGRVRRLAETRDADGRHRLWLATFDAGLWWRDGERWRAVEGNSDLPPSILSVAQTRDLGGHQRLWAGTGANGVWYFEAGRWQPLRDPRLGGAQVEGLLPVQRDGHEALWISTFGSGLARLDGNGLRVWTQQAGELPTNALYELAHTQLPDRSDVIWVGSRFGLLRVQGDRVVAFGREHGLPSNVVRGVSAWRSPAGADVLWLATEHGVARTIVGASPWQTAALFGTHGGSGVFSVRVDSGDDGNERLWVASSGDGLRWHEGGVWHRAEWLDGRPVESETRMIRRTHGADGRSTLWAGVGDGRLGRVRSDQRLDPVATPWRIAPGESVLDILERSTGGHDELWVATRASGVFRRREGRWDNFLPGDGRGVHRVTALVDQHGTDGRRWLWATSLQGLMRIADDGTVTTFGRSDGLRDEALLGASMLPDAQGRAVLWLGSGNAGIERVDVSDPHHPLFLPADLPPPPDPTAYSAVRDSHGIVYICTNNGVQQLVPTPSGWSSRVFTRADGVAHDECNTNAQFIDAHDRFWTGTLGGLAVFDPERALADDHAKALHVVDVRVDGKRVDAHAGVQLPSGRHPLHVGFALLSWQRETESQFRTQIVGIDADAGPWTNDPQRDVEGLPPGQYVMRIEGRDYAGNASTPIDLPIEVAPFWWQRPLAHLAVAIALLLLVHAFLRLRTRSLEAQRTELAEQVRRRTAELHETNARLVDLSYRDALTGLANRRRLREVLDARVGRNASTVAFVFADVDGFKEYNDSHGHPAGDEALCRVADGLRECVPATAIVARYGGEEFACLLECGLDDARDVARRMCATIEQRPISVPGTDLIRHVTVSIGIAARVLATAADVHELLREADVALYAAKNAGRNRVHG